MTLESDTLIASMPLPHSAETMAPTLKLSFQPSMTGLDISWTLDPASESNSDSIRGAIDQAGKVGLDVVMAVALVEKALEAM